RWAPVRVTATNGGPAGTGRLELGVPGAQTALPLELPSAAKKRVGAALIPPVRYTPDRINSHQAAAAPRGGAGRGQGGREVARAQIPIQVVPDGARLLAVCGEEAGGLRFLDELPLGAAGWALPRGQPAPSQGEATVTAHLAPAQMPHDPVALEGAE